MSPLPLHGRASNNITLLEAMRNCASALSEGFQGIAILYSPTRCRFAKVQPDGTLTDAKGLPLDLSLVFEARAFNETSELRWLNELDGKGRAVLLSELDISKYLTDFIPDLVVLDTISQDYLLWGKGFENTLSPGWGQLASARIGSIDVPVSGLSANGHVYLKAREYLCECLDGFDNTGDTVARHGNVIVAEERLMGLEVRL